ncbi:hypothetical protein CJO92_06800 [Ralstonia solanacearum]|uniref:Uncharacterized protein n=1 Tax=Ralstonia solanacearum TaxID=305 RepID=A0AAD0WFR7_RALSL|nr:hypothetical protein CJO77_06800 [Ralstonia solanacearum]AXW52427.1 hypothetical protein CJO92_06800 [Ralstonia solanacearum]
MLVGLTLFSVSCRADQAPCDVFVRVDVPAQHRMIWICAQPDWAIAADRGVAIEEARRSPSRRIVSVAGLGRVKIGTRHAIELLKDDVTVDGVSMAKEHHAAIDARGAVVLGAFIRDFD